MPYSPTYATRADTRETLWPKILAAYIAQKGTAARNLPRLGEPVRITMAKVLNTILGV